MLKKLFVAVAVLALAAPAFALVASKDGSVVTIPNGTPVDQPMGDRTDVMYNTGGAWDTVCTSNGSASGWSYYQMNVWTNTTGEPQTLVELGFPTNEYSSDPIAMPVEWNVDLNQTSIYNIINPYSHAWDGVGTFYPAGAPDTSPPTVYSIIDCSGAGLVLPDTQSMVWGYENAGLCGQISYNGVETIGWYVSYWDSDVPYGRTGVQRFKSVGFTAAEESSLSQVKSLY
ncbi:hypothetical protein FJ251_09885 [bacterium]|nr:hypothetical protein [bacterium]